MTSVETRVRDGIGDDSVDQDELVSELSNEGLDQGEVLKTLRGLMERDEVSYTAQWDLKLRE